MAYNRRAVALHIAVFVGGIAHQGQIPRGLNGPVALGRAVGEHHHEHLDGGGICHARTERIEHVLLRHHRHAQSPRRMQAGQRIGGLQQTRNRDNHVVHFAEPVHVAVAHRPECFRPQHRRPTEGSVALWHIPHDILPHGAAVGVGGGHTLDLERVRHIPNLVRGVATQDVFRTSNGVPFRVDWKAIDVHLA